MACERSWCLIWHQVVVSRKSQTTMGSLQMLASELADTEPSRQLPVPPGGCADGGARTGEEVRFTWKLENFAAFRTILETRKVFSRYAHSDSNRDVFVAGIIFSAQIFIISLTTSAYGEAWELSGTQENSRKHHCDLIFGPMDGKPVLLYDYPAEGEVTAALHVYRFFAAEGCKLRVGAYTSLNTLCTYLESDVSAEGQAERNFWVSFLVPAGSCMTNGGLNFMTI